ncbi:MAG: zinc-ribbon domain-containing protein [Desulfuromonadaceae bacterium]|nr:zinc-ribbon domain-containing protein [Desulfuromonadaceae bacterium]MDD5105806.1 zinc-ribbon domain-containing protein [Desulfuromonadaceae bacterium]
MKISCPKCHACGTIADHEVPQAGRYITCPRCKEGFTIFKPRAGNDGYLVDTCPSCSFSTFGDETFSTCPKCGIEVKTYIDRQRDEQRLKHEQELLVKKRTVAAHTEAAVHLTTTPPVVAPVPLSQKTVAPVAEHAAPLDIVDVISFGVAVVAIVALAIGLWGAVGYDTSKIQAMLLERRGELLSGFSVFLRYGLLNWLGIAYGLAALAVSALLMKRLQSGLRALIRLLRLTMILVPGYYIFTYISWLLAPIPHTVSGHLVELINIVVMGALLCAPLYLFERFLHNRKITSVVTR